MIREANSYGSVSTRTLSYSDHAPERLPQGQAGLRKKAEKQKGLRIGLLRLLKQLLFVIGEIKSAIVESTNHGLCSNFE